MVTKIVHLKASPLRFSATSGKAYSLFKPSDTTRFFSTQALCYGPSLYKGRTPPQTLPLRPTRQPESAVQLLEDEKNLIDEDKFTRIFDIAALRVPAKDCFALESRLRGHLLNWSRVRNIARVPGDEVDQEVVGLLPRLKDAGDDGEADGCSVLFREKLVKEFNYRGFQKFRNLARISRPPKRKKKEAKVEDGEEYGRKASSLVQVVGEARDEMRGLLGEGFQGPQKWMGSTRLLLLDERYAHKEVEELPPAVKAVFVEGTMATMELVRCQLTLYYGYWQMNEILEFLLPKGVIVPSAFETVGHIAHLNLKDEHLPFKKVIAKVVLDKNSPKIRTVVNKIDAINNDYRTMQLEVLAGNHSLVTTVLENGLRFHVDLATVYWNSRLATERQRLLDGFNRNDVIFDYLERNSVLNKVERKIEVFNMDGRRFIKAMLSSEKAHSITQVVMNLPNNAVEFLDSFRGAYRDQPSDKEISFPTVHVYGFSKAEDPEFDFHERIRISLQEVAVDVGMRRVRLVAPGKWMLCASFILPKSVAFARTMLNT